MSYEELIKDIINKDHVNKLYNENDLPNIINGIKLLIICEHEVVDDCALTINVTQFLHYSSTDVAFYFNANRKQSKLREYHNKIIKKMKIGNDHNIFVETVLENDQKIVKEPVKKI